MATELRAIDADRIPRAGAWLVSPDRRRLCQLIGVEPDGRYALEDAVAAVDGVHEVLLIGAQVLLAWREVQPLKEAA